MGRYVGLTHNRHIKAGGVSSNILKTTEYESATGITTDSDNNVTEITLGENKYEEVTYNNVGLITSYVEIIGGESITYNILYDAAGIVTSIREQQPPAPTYSFSAVPASIGEGSTGICTIVTTDVNPGTVFYWDVTNPSDFDVSQQSGSFILGAGIGTFSVGPRIDYLTEGVENFRVNVRYPTASGAIVTTSDPIQIADDSLTPTYSVQVPASIDEGATGICTVVTTNLYDGDIVYWDLLPSLIADINPTSGSVTMSANTATINLSAIADYTAEGPETFQVKLYSDSAKTVNVATSSSITINDTSQFATGQQTYTIPGTHTWVAPEGVSSVSVVCVGGGAGGDNGWYDTTQRTHGAGGGGGLGYANNIPVTEGQSYTLVVGYGGTGGSSGLLPEDAGDGGDSWFLNPTTVNGKGGKAWHKRNMYYVVGSNKTNISYRDSSAAHIQLQNGSEVHAEGGDFNLYYRLDGVKGSDASYGGNGAYVAGTVKIKAGMKIKCRKTGLNAAIYHEPSSYQRSHCIMCAASGGNRGIPRDDLSDPSWGHPSRPRDRYGGNAGSGSGGGGESLNGSGGGAGGTTYGYMSGIDGAGGANGGDLMSGSASSGSHFNGGSGRSGVDGNGGNGGSGYFSGGGGGGGWDSMWDYGGYFGAGGGGGSTYVGGLPSPSVDSRSPAEVVVSGPSDGGNGSNSTASAYIWTAEIVYGTETSNGQGIGGTYIGDGGGNGGKGGRDSYNTAGGGGAGGYSGNGGDGQDNINSTIPTDGSGGAGGGGSTGNRDSSLYGGSGGGVGLLGEGTSGAAGSFDSNDGSTSINRAGKGGSGGTDGDYGSGGSTAGNFGGGGRSGLQFSNGNVTAGSSGASGGVRIIWGPNRSFPSTNTGDV